MTPLMIRIAPLLVAVSALLFTSCDSLTPSEQLSSMFEKSIDSGSSNKPLSRNDATEKRRNMDRRAVRAREIVEKDELASAQDAYRAAVILYDSQKIEDITLAQELATRAHKDGYSEGIRLVAHCMDRSLMMRRKPQHFGTQVVFEAVLTKWRLWDLEPATTDSERDAFGIAPLVELQARVGYLNEKR